jgi:hypothetical protein
MLVTKALLAIRTKKYFKTKSATRGIQVIVNWTLIVLKSPSQRYLRKFSQLWKELI